MILKITAILFMILTLHGVNCKLKAKILEVELGTKVTLTCPLGSKGKIGSYRWLFLKSKASVASRILRLHSMDKEKYGVYKCQYTNSFGAKSQFLVELIRPVTLLPSTNYKKVKIGTKVKLHCGLNFGDKKTTWSMYDKKKKKFLTVKKQGKKDYVIPYMSERTLTTWRCESMYGQPTEKGEFSYTIKLFSGFSKKIGDILKKPGKLEMRDIILLKGAPKHVLKCQLPQLYQGDAHEITWFWKLENTFGYKRVGNDEVSNKTMKVQATEKASKLLIFKPNVKTNGYYKCVFPSEGTAFYARITVIAEQEEFDRTSLLWTTTEKTTTSLKTTTAAPLYTGPTTEFWPRPYTGSEDCGKNDCDCRCKGAPEEQFCGDDDMKYFSKCEVVCKEVETVPCDCNFVCKRQPGVDVCGIDGKTYISECFARCKLRKKTDMMGKDYVRHNGPCKDDCVKNCVAKGAKAGTQCGMNWREYPSKCVMDCEKVELRHPGPCFDIPCDIKCNNTKSSRKVCAADGKLYKNSCLAKCHSYYLVNTRGICNIQTKECVNKCGTKKDPVCAVYTFKNACYAKCVLPKNRIEHKGYCKSRMDFAALDFKFTIAEDKNMLQMLCVCTKACDTQSQLNLRMEIVDRNGTVLQGETLDQRNVTHVTEKEGHNISDFRCILKYKAIKFREYTAVSPKDIKHLPTIAHIKGKKPTTSIMSLDKCEKRCAHEPDVQDFICASDWQTYLKKCVMKCRGATFRYKGFCVNAPCQEKCKYEKPEKTCGIDGKEYKNRCEAECFAGVMEHGVCNPDPKCKKKCGKKKKKPVCVSMAGTFYNECYAKCAKKDEFEPGNCKGKPQYDKIEFKLNVTREENQLKMTCPCSKSCENVNGLQVKFSDGDTIVGAHDPEMQNSDSVSVQAETTGKERILSCKITKDDVVFLTYTFKIPAKSREEKSKTF